MVAISYIIRVARLLDRMSCPWSAHSGGGNGIGIVFPKFPVSFFHKVNGLPLDSLPVSFYLSQLATEFSPTKCWLFG